MSKYIKLEDVIKKVEEHILPDFRGKVRTILSDLPTIEVSEDCLYTYCSRCGMRVVVDAPSVVPTQTNAIQHTQSVESVESVETTTEQSSKVGEWQITDAYPHNVYCSECHKKFAQTHWDIWEDGSLPRNYCPNCGCKMKG